MRKLPERRTPCGATSPFTPSGMGRTVTAGPVPLAEEPQAPATTARAEEVVPPLPRPLVRPLSPGGTRSGSTGERWTPRARAASGSPAAHRFPTAISQRSSTWPSPRRSSGSNPRRFGSARHPGRTSRRPTPHPPRATFPRPSAGSCASATETDAVTSTGAGRRCGERHHLEYHHLHPFGFGGTAGPRTSACCTGPTTHPWPNTTTAARRWLGSADPGSGSTGRRPSRRPVPRRIALARRHGLVTALTPRAASRTPGR